jgi:hypothetical protein
VKLVKDRKCLALMATILVAVAATLGPPGAPAGAVPRMEPRGRLPPPSEPAPPVTV